ncbi:TetR/AcrR family transcriptional regulator [Caulobacter sp. KR2-114]|uniref:TetR/AcrR family transcriptional regulator n=1 Tax=Caulobacter sp. KR2-114 TaxID=3400912 RepID=UPI003C08347F
MPDGSIAVTAKFGRKRDTIVAAATELLNREGVKGMTLAKVAERVGLITTSVTYYFKKKEDLAAACFLRGIERIETVVAEAQAGGSPEARLEILLDRYLALKGRVLSGQEPPIPVFSDIRALTDEPHRQVLEAYLRLFRAVRELLRGTPDHAGLHGTAFTQMVLEQLHWLQAWLHRYPEAEFGEVRARMHDILLRGLGAPGQAWSPRPLDPAAIHPAEGGQRETFLLAATRLINQQGYRGASVDKISASLNVTKGSFYHHHSAKDDVVVSCFSRSFQVVRAAQDAALALPDADAWTRLSSAAAALMGFQLSPHGPLLRTSALSALPEGMRVEMVAQSNRLSERWAAMIADGAAEGSLRPVDPFIAAQMFNAGLNASSDLPVLLGGVTAHQLVDLYARPMLTGLQPA